MWSVLLLDICSNIITLELFQKLKLKTAYFYMALIFVPKKGNLHISNASYMSGTTLSIYAKCIY